MTRRRDLIGVLIAALLLPLAPARANESAAVEPIAALNQALLGIMKAGHATPFPRRYAMLAPVLERAFDITGILRACVGPRWSSLDARERAELLTVFRRFTVASYVANFDSYSGERLEVLPEIRGVGADRVVATRLLQTTGESVRIDYVMRQEPDGWKVVDVLLDGTISRVAVQRSDFRSLLAADSDASALIASLQSKVTDLSHGTLLPG